MAPKQLQQQQTLQLFKEKQVALATESLEKSSNFLRLVKTTQKARVLSKLIPMYQIESTL